MEIIERIVSNGHGPAHPSYLVIHDTDDPGADANRLWEWWNSRAGRIQGYQVHYVVDWNGTLIHAVPDDRKAWHCGNGNVRSIGLEICVPKDASLYPRVWEYAVEAAKTILDRKGWGTDRMVSHKYAADTWGGSDHQDPIAFFARMGHTWDDFVAAVNGQEVGPTSTVVEQRPAPQQQASPADSSIAEVQSWLGCAADGIYGPDTKRHLVRKLQQELNAQFGAGLADDGIWGPKTRAACVNVRRGAKGDITRVLQGALICRGYDTGGFDGVFGGKTYDAVRSYQADHGLSDDGVAGKATFGSLLG